MFQLLCGLRYLEKAGVLHRDLKPQNIFLFDGPPLPPPAASAAAAAAARAAGTAGLDVPVLRIADFGVARSTVRADVRRPSFDPRRSLQKAVRAVRRNSNSAATPPVPAPAPARPSSAGTGSPPPLKRQMTAFNIMTESYKAPEVTINEELTLNEGTMRRPGLILRIGFAADMYGAGLIFGEMLQSLCLGGAPGEGGECECGSSAGRAGPLLRGKMLAAHWELVGPPTAADLERCPQLHGLFAGAVVMKDFVVADDGHCHLQTGTEPLHSRLWPCDEESECAAKKIGRGVPGEYAVRRWEGVAERVPGGWGRGGADADAGADNRAGFGGCECTAAEYTCTVTRDEYGAKSTWGGRRELVGFTAQEGWAWRDLAAQRNTQRAGRGSGGGGAWAGEGVGAGFCCGERFTAGGAKAALLLRRLLRVHPDDRLTPEEALEGDYLKHFARGADGAGVRCGSRGGTRGGAGGCSFAELRELAEAGQEVDQQLERDLPADDGGRCGGLQLEEDSVMRAEVQKVLARCNNGPSPRRRWQAD
jgi:serine/threonine protein kinase